MHFFHSELNVATIIIAMLEVSILFAQFIYFLERPGDRNRLWYLLLLCVLILYNVCNGLLPDDKLSIPVMAQIIFTYFLGAGMSMYFVFYLHSAFRLPHLKFFAAYGALLFILCPFVLVFAIPYYFTGDLELCRNMLVIIPLLYSIAFVYSVTKALALKHRGEKFSASVYEEVISVYISLIFFALLPVITYFENYPVWGHSLTNIGFFVITIANMRWIIRKSRIEHKQLEDSEQRLQQMNEKLTDLVLERTIQLEDANAGRVEKFIKLAHETRTPLTLINNYLNDYIDTAGDSPELEVIRVNLQKINADMVKFFDIERYNEDFEKYDHESNIINLSDIVRSSLILFRSFAGKKSIEIMDEIEGDIVLKAHPGAIERIINNLLVNAVKYTPNGGTIKVNLSSSDNRVSITVSDTGIGIPEAMYEKIFQPYIRLNQINSEGIGIGLSIVKKIIDGLKGEIQIKSGGNAGTEITIVFPKLVKGETEVTNWNPAGQVATTNGNIRDEINFPDKPYILVVEDDHATLSYLILRLSPHYNVYTAKDGMSALGKLTEIKSLDLIISDVMMEIMDGFSFYDEVAALKVYDHIPFIFLTAKESSTDRLRGLSRGAIDYISKPFLINELLHKVESILSKFRKQRLALLDSAYQNIIPNASEKKVAAVDSSAQQIIEANCKLLGLTSREIEVCLLLITGLQYKGIAAQLDISENTVAKHISNIFIKAKVGNKVELLKRLESSHIDV